MSEYSPAYLGHLPERVEVTALRPMPPLTTADIDRIRRERAIRALRSLQARARQLWRVIETAPDPVECRRETAKLVAAVSTCAEFAIVDLTPGVES